MLNKTTQKRDARQMEETMTFLKKDLELEALCVDKNWSVIEEYIDDPAVLSRLAMLREMTCEVASR